MMAEDRSTPPRRLVSRRGRVPGLAPDKGDQPGIFNPDADITGGIARKSERFPGETGRRAARDRVAASRYGKR